MLTRIPVLCIQCKAINEASNDTKKTKEAQIRSIVPIKQLLAAMRETREVGNTTKK